MKTAQWIRPDEIRSVPTLYRFTRVFTAAQGGKFTVRVSADSRYRLSLNGRFLMEGPCHGTGYRRHFESADLSQWLCEGENRLQIDVLHVTDGVWISLYRESTAALWLDAALTRPDGVTEAIVSEPESWVCARAENHAFREFPGFIRSIPPVEELRGAERFVPVPVRFFSEATPETQGFNEYGVRETYSLVPRPIPPLSMGEAKTMHCIGRGETWADYDAGRYETAYLHLTLSGKAGTTVRLYAAECKAKEADGKTVKGMRDDPEGQITGPYDTLILGEDGTLSFDSFYWRAFRYLRLEGDAPFTVCSLTCSPYYYPMGDEGRVISSDERFNRMWEVSRHTVMCCAHDNYVDCPFYEQQQYDMDSGLQMLFTLRMTADTALPRKSIEDLAHSQLPDGMLQANYPSVVVQVIPSFSLFWVLMLRDYLLYTGDLAFVKRMFGCAEKVLSGFENMLDERGLVMPTVYWPFVDWAPEWGITGVPAGGTKEPLTVNTLLYAYTLKTAAQLAEAVGHKGEAEDWRRRAEEANAAALACCYDEKRGLFRNTPDRRDYSQHTAVWGVLSGAVRGREAEAMMRRVMEEDVSRCTFSMNYYLFRALEKTGLYDAYCDRVFAGWQTMLDLHCTTWCENPDNPRSECHGWSAAPIYELSAVWLGVKPEADGYSRLRIAPRTARFEEMDGTVPTPHGLIRVQWHREGSRTALTVTLPDPRKMHCTVCCGGKETVQTDEVAVYTF